jgi:CheY-like chemotaxis protein
LCIAQDPDTADFPGMPQSLTYAGYTDQVWRAEDIPAALVRYVQNPYLEFTEEVTSVNEELETGNGELVTVNTQPNGSRGSRKRTSSVSRARCCSRPKTALPGIEVLVVEDVTAARDAVQRLLEQHGTQVRAVTSAALTTEAFMVRRPDVIVADIGMPDEDGYSMISHLREIEQEQGTPRVPAVAVTAFARTEDRERALSAGFDEHVPKPINPDDLIGALARLARKR